eukprot:gnl/MRDRNA2_/MRDRNA2_22503_c0_seq1.p1 gnl/MRDRNA2_/MRDRNA2_22503_c0~~gnl/MRDRNA2_/MRDRNA2_22503_c0_seq1.p1  ORF type:complete len:364 (-),score=68.08 gnl/MRDRNA2_/MRDRNA2_22503_c0_seq1:188-1279(-)
MATEQFPKEGPAVQQESAAEPTEEPTKPTEEPKKSAADPADPVVRQSPTAEPTEKQLSLDQLKDKVGNQSRQQKLNDWKEEKTKNQTVASRSLLIDDAVNGLVKLPCTDKKTSSLSSFEFCSKQVDCIWQPVSQLCGNVGKKFAKDILCVPIESLQDNECRKRIRHTADVQRLFLHKGSMIDVMYKGFKRRVYLDLGARDYLSSIGDWFMARYPAARKFKVIAFEAEHLYDESYKIYPGGGKVELHHFAVWIKNGSISWHNKFISGAGESRRPAIDIADFIRRRTKEDDYLVVKMDIEGAEYTVIPHLIAAGVTHLIDEIFIEVHTERNSCCRPPNDKGRHWPDAMRLIQNLRDRGVYAHEWI